MNFIKNYVIDSKDEKNKKMIKRIEDYCQNKPGKLDVIYGDDYVLFYLDQTLLYKLVIK